MTHNIRLGYTGNDVYHSDAQSFFNHDFFIKRNNLGMNLVSENVQHPFLRVRALQAADLTTVFDAKQDSAALQICKSDYFFGQLFRAHVIAFELYAGILSVSDNFQ